MRKLKWGVTPKLALVLMLFAAALLAGIGLFAYHSGRAALEAATVAELLSTAIEKEAELNAWIEDRRGDVASFAASPRLLEEVASLNGPDAAAAHDRLVAELRPHVAADGVYLEYFVIAPDTGEVIVSTDPDQEGKFRENRLYFLNGRLGPYVQNVYYSTALQGPTMTATAPLRSAEGRLLGVLAARLNLDRLNAIVQRRTGLRQSDDAFLVNTSSLFVTQPRHVSDPAVLQRGIHTEAVQRCLAGGSGTITAADYRGVSALTVYRWLPERKMCLIAEVGEAEAVAPVRAFGQAIALGGGLVLASASVLAFALARTITGPVKQLMAGARELGSGQLDTRIAIKTGDELEQLAGAFAQMAENLQKTLVSRADLLKEIAERKQAEEALRESENTVRTWLNAIQESAFLMDGAGLVLAANATVAQRLHCSVEELVGAYIYDFIPPQDARTRRLHVAQVIESGQPVHFEDERLGHIIDNLIYPVFDQAGQVKHLAVLGTDITERNQAEEKLRASEMRWRTLMQHLPAFIVEADTEGVILALNRTQPGFALSDYVGRSLFDVVAPDSRDQFKLAFAQVLKEAALVEYEAPGYGPNQQPAWYHRQLVPIVQDEAIRSILMVANDITERKRAEADLRESEERFSIAFYSSPTPQSIITVSDSEILAINDAVCGLFGYTREELIGQTTTNLNIWADPKDRDIAVEQLRTTGRVRIQEATIRTKSGDMRTVLASIEPILWQGIPCLISSTLDITERKRMEDELNRLNAELEQRVAERTAELSDLYNDAPCGYHSLDGDGVFVRINDTELAWLGYTREEVIGKMKAPDLFTPASVETFRQNFPIFKARGWLRDLELDMVRKDGSILPVLLSAVGVADQDGRYLMSRSTMIDYTERKRTETVLRESQAKLESANKELEAFSYSVSHDLRAPLRGIDGWSLALLEDYAEQLDETARQYLDRVRAEAQRMGHLIDDLLQLSRVTRTDMQIRLVDLTGLAQTVAARLKEAQPERQVEVVIQPGLTASADAGLLEAVLTNLLGNAWKFTAPRLQGCIEFGCLEPSPDGAEGGGGSFVYFVRDNGVGFDMTYAQKLFGAFQRMHKAAEFPGTGIGLATVQRIIHRHGGRVWAEAEVGRGATFYFTLEEAL